MIWKTKSDDLKWVNNFKSGNYKKMESGIVIDMNSWPSAHISWLFELCEMREYDWVAAQIWVDFIGVYWNLGFD